MLTETGWKGFLYSRFRKQEIDLYKVSDFIGCMSPANVEYLLKHNTFLDKKKVEIAPNSIQLNDDYDHDNEEKRAVTKRYGLPTDKPIFIYGGNLGQPHGIPFLMTCLDEVKRRENCHFVIVGTGTYLQTLLEWQGREKPASVTVMKGLPKEEYDQLVQACDIGLIFLDYRFTIPNFPSRLLSYLKYKMPIISVTDPNCDMGAIAKKNGFGIYVPSNDKTLFTLAVNRMLDKDIKTMGEKGYKFLREKYLVENTYDAIMRHFL